MAYLLSFNLLCFGLIATYSESPLICLDKLTQTPYSFSLRLLCFICFSVTYQALERSKLFVFMFIVHLSILLGKFQQSRDLGLCASESPHPAQGLEKASKDTSLMGKWINEAISQCWIPGRTLAGLTSQESYPKMSTLLGQGTPSMFLLRSHFSTEKALTDSYSSDSVRWKLCSRQRDQPWVLTPAHFKQMQRGHFFSGVCIASCAPSVAQMNKPTLSWPPQPGSC